MKFLPVMFVETNQISMANYIISGIWKNEHGIIPSGLTSTSIKISKQELLELLMHPDNSAQTLGEKYLRTNPD